MRLSDITIHRKLVLLVFIALCGIVATSAIAFRFTLDDVLNSRKAQIQSVVQAGLSQLRALNERRVQNTLSQQAYDEQLRLMVQATRFSGNEYLFLFDVQGNSIAHPTLPNLVGKNQFDLQDDHGNYVVRTMIDGITRDGNVFFRFYWPKPEGGPPVPKLAYAEHVQGTNLILGSGIYLDDLTPLYRARASTYLAVTLGALLIVAFTAARIARNIARPVTRLSAQMNALADGDLEQELIDTERKDEVGNMARAVQCLRDHAIENQRLRHMQEQVTFLETFDPATRLYNRQALGETINKEIARHDKEHSQLAVVVLRLDLLHELAIEFGRERSDQLLVEVATRIHDQLRADDMLARLSEDTFGLLLPNISSLEQLEGDCRRLLAILEEPILLDEQRVLLGGRAGISLYPHDGGYDFQLIGRAENTVNLAKKQERDLLFYNAVAHREPDHSIELWQEMQRAMDEDQFYLVFQPLYDLVDNSLVGAEVLLRWDHPEKGFISPAQFIPVAEQSGLISRLDAWVLEAAAKQIRSWLDRQLTPPRIAVNLSGISFLRADFLDTLHSIFERHNVPLKYLDLELTEGVLIDDLERISNQLARIRATGVSVSIDDFGTGYSSLSRIKNLAIDHVKIDRSFIEELDTSFQDRKIVEAIVLMAQGLNLRVIAEGVETQDQLAELRRIGCDMVQGFFLSRPLKVEPFEELLEQDLVIEFD